MAMRRCKKEAGSGGNASDGDHVVFAGQGSARAAEYPTVRHTLREVPARDELHLKIVEEETPLWNEDQVYACAQEKQAIGRVYTPGEKDGVHLHGLLVFGANGQELIDEATSRAHTPRESRGT